MLVFAVTIQNILVFSVFSREILNQYGFEESADHFLNILQIPSPISSAEKRVLKATAQKLEPLLKIGKNGVSDSFITSLETELNLHELVKVKFIDFKEQKKELAPQLAEKTGSHLIMRIGNVAVYYRKRTADGVT